MTMAPTPDDRADRPEGEPVRWPEVPEPPAAPPIPDLLQRPVERPASMTRQQPTPSDAMKAASGYASALTFIGTILVFGAIGWAVDRWLKAAPWGLIAGLTLGMIGGTFRLVRDANRPMK